MIPFLHIHLQPTIHGNCKTHYSINAREDIATDISLTRDLSRCDKFNPMRDPTSPWALISGMVSYASYTWVGLVN